jgi:hypothetical protein
VDELANCFANEPTTASDNIICSVVAESLCSGTQHDHSLDNKPFRANVETTASYKLGSKQALELKGDVRDAFESIVTNKDNLKKFCAKGGLPSNGHFINLQSAVSLLVEEAIMPYSVLREALFERKV